MIAPHASRKGSVKIHGLFVSTTMDVNYILSNLGKRYNNGELHALFCFDLIQYVIPFYFLYSTD